MFGPYAMSPWMRAAAGLFEVGGRTLVRDPTKIVVIVRGSEESERNEGVKTGQGLKK